MLLCLLEKSHLRSIQKKSIIGPNLNLTQKTGVVDRSTEIASQVADPLTLDTLFDYVADFEMETSSSQVNTQEYCEEKARQEKAAAAAEENQPEGFYE